MQSAVAKPASRSQPSCVLDVGAAVVAHALACAVDLRLGRAQGPAVIHPPLRVDHGELWRRGVDLLGVGEHAARPQDAVDPAASAPVCRRPRGDGWPGQRRRRRTGPPAARPTCRRRVRRSPRHRGAPARAPASPRSRRAARSPRPGKAAAISALRRPVPAPTSSTRRTSPQSSAPATSTTAP